MRRARRMSESTNTLSPKLRESGRNTSRPSCRLSVPLRPSKPVTGLTIHTVLDLSATTSRGYPAPYENDGEHDPRSHLVFRSAQECGFTRTLSSPSPSVVTSDQS